LNPSNLKHLFILVINSSSQMYSQLAPILQSGEITLG